MDSAVKKTLAIEIIILWAVPIFSAIISIRFWYDMPAYLAYLWLSSAVCVLIVVGTGISYFHFWEWRTMILPRFLFVHRLFSYAAYANLFYVIAGKLLIRSLSAWTIIESVLLIGAVSMSIGVLQEYLCVDAGIYRINVRRVGNEMGGTFKLVTGYAYYYFGLFGLMLGLTAQIGHWYIIESTGRHVGLLAFLLGIIASLPFLLWWFVLAHVSKNNSLTPPPPQPLPQ